MLYGTVILESMCVCCAVGSLSLGRPAVLSSSCGHQRRKERGGHTHRERETKQEEAICIHGATSHNQTGRELSCKCCCSLCASCAVLALSEKEKKRSALEWGHTRGLTSPTEKNTKGTNQRP